MITLFLFVSPLPPVGKRWTSFKTIFYKYTKRIGIIIHVKYIVVSWYNILSSRHAHRLWVAIVKTIYLYKLSSLTDGYHLTQYRYLSSHVITYILIMPWQSLSRQGKFANDTSDLIGYFWDLRSCRYIEHTVENMLLSYHTYYVS